MNTNIGTRLDYPGKVAFPKLSRDMDSGFREGERRRQIDPSTCERHYTDDEAEFMRALEVYKLKSGRKFPTCCEILEVLRGLGYAKVQE